jgi:hypothetical protein
VWSGHIETPHVQRFQASDCIFQIW